MYSLYWDRGSANMAPHAVLREIAVPFQLVRIDVAAGRNRDADYLRLNPNHRVPTLVDGDKIIYESAAIVLYLCESHTDAGLMPLPGEADRHLFLQWLFYFTNTLQEDLQHWWHADNYVDAHASRKDMKIVADRRLADILSRIDGGLGGVGPYMLGQRFSAIDIYLTMLCRWTRQMARPALAYPNLKNLVDLVTARPTWAAMMEAEGITWSGNIP